MLLINKWLIVPIIALILVLSSFTLMAQPNSENIASQEVSQDATPGKVYLEAPLEKADEATLGTTTGTITGGGTSECTEPECGNDILETGEECDDGNLNTYDGCTNECKHRMKKIDMNTCTGNGALYLYKGENSFQPIETTFKVYHDQLLIFTWARAEFSAKVNGISTPVNLVKDIVGAYKVYSLATTPGSTVEISGPQDVGGALGYWKLDEDSGTSALDSSGNGHTGTLLNGPAWTNGIIGGALSFDGIDDRVKISGLLGQPSSITVAAWVNLNKADINRAEVISLGDHVLLMADESANGIAGLYYDGTYDRWTNTGMKIAGTGWHHLAYVIDSVNHVQKIYVDGVLKATTSYSGSILYTGGGPDTYIGTHGNGWSNADFNGSIDDVRVYGSALDINNIKKLYSQGNNGTIRFVQGYLAQDSSSPLFDISTARFDINDIYTAQQYMVPGVYNYLFFDKYSYNSLGVTQDYRRMNVSVSWNGGVISTKSYNHPFPSGTQGAVVDSYTIAQAGKYNITLDTADSIYWPLDGCPEPVCGDGKINLNEECDDGNTNTYDECMNDCTIRMKKIPISTCTGDGELYLYKGTDPFQPYTTSFTVDRDQLLIFTWTATNFTVKVNNIPAPLSLAKDLGSYKAYLVPTSPGDVISVNGTSLYGARRIQGYLSQDSSNPVYDISTLQFVFNNEKANTMYLTSGVYSYVFFDKYTINLPPEGQDNRKLNPFISGLGGTVTNKTYTQPFPVGTQGAVVDTYIINEAGDYTLDLKTEDSIYWPLVSCPKPSIDLKLIKTAGSAPDGETLYVVAGSLVEFNYNLTYPYNGSSGTPDPIINTNPTTCDNIWGFDCGAQCENGPEGDNTFDSCSNCDSDDERINNIYLNQTEALAGNSVGVTCEYYTHETTEDELYVYYRNSTSGTWKKQCSGSSSGTGNTVRNWTQCNVPLDNVVGTHQIRCSIALIGENDECQNDIDHWYYDNDDVSIKVYTGEGGSTYPCPLYNVTVTDDKLGYVGMIPVLNPGESVLLKKSAIVDSTQTNVGTAVGQSCMGEASDTDDAVVVAVNPGINIQKLAGTAPEDTIYYTDAGPVTFTYIVRNTGDTYLVFLNATDDNGTAGNINDDYLFNGANKAVLSGLILAPHTEINFTHVIPVLQNRVNIARDYGTAAFANGTPIPGIPVVTGMDDAEVRINTCPNPQQQINVTVFSDGTSLKLIQFPQGGGTDSTTKIKLPLGAEVVDARVNITGIPEHFSNENPVDISIVNDVSNSMDDNCGPDGIAQPGETPCKINDLKNATSNLLNILLNATSNKVSLVSYSTGLVNYMNLTNNLTSLHNFVNNITTVGRTCISCGIKKGTEVLSNGTNPTRFMILMSDGEANNCLPGVVCPNLTAKAEAIAWAANAWQNHSIHVNTIAFGADADALTMQNIAQAGNGTFYSANETNLTLVFEHIGMELTDTNPTNPTLDIGADGIIDWSTAGAFTQTIKLENFEDELTSLLDNCTCTGCFLSSGNCTIDFKTTSTSTGKLQYDNLFLAYLTPCLYCGDGVTQQDLGEECDDGNTASGDGCDAECQTEYCGDGITQQGIGEECDDGNTASGDGCDAECQMEICGDGTVQQNLGEQCELPNTQNNAFCSQTNSTCSGPKFGVRDNFGSCNSECDCLSDSFNYQCVLGKCGAQCDSNEDCLPSTCSVIFNDTCVGKQLKEYDNDKVMDSTTVNNATANTCDTATTCGCSNVSVSCNPPGTQQYCVEGLCGAICDNANDYMAVGGICSYGCDYGNSCVYANTCPLANYCAGPMNNTYFYGGTCSSAGCSFSQQNCDSLDYYESFTTYCDGDTVKTHRRFHDFSCSLTGCTETVSFVDESIVENCNLRDGTLHNQCGNEDWTCSAVNATVAQCSIKNITANNTLCPNFCSSDIRNYNGVCNPSTYQCQYTQEDCNHDGTYCVNDDVITRDYYCSPPSCLFNVTNTQDCAIESWTEGGDSQGFGLDPSCIFTHGFCTGADRSAQCTSNVTSTADFDNLDNSTRCFGVRSGMTDYYCALQTCNGGCNFGYVDYPNGCSLFCGAGCQDNEDCSPSICSVIYNDTCVGKQLKEYDNDKVMDSTTVNNATSNTCDTADTCSCSNNSVGCDPPGTQQYCVEGLCGAICDNVNDYMVTDGTCNYGCDYGDSCEYDNTCPLANYCAGPMNNTYFYGGQCSSQGCSFSQEDCSLRDYVEDTGIKCDGNKMIHTYKNHNYTCSLTGCIDVITQFNTTIEDCDSRDGALYNQCGQLDWSCSEELNAVHCIISSINKNVSKCGPNFCNVDIRNYDPFCNNDFYCQYQQEDCNHDGTYCVDDDVITRDYYCSPPSCLFNITNTQDCAIESWTEGGDTPQYGEDPACIFTHGFCTGADKFAQCTSNVTSTADFDNMDDPDVCFGVRSGMTDYYCALQTCNGGCNFGYVDYPNGCSLLCGAGCEINEDCEPSMCEVIYNDTCVGKQLKEYDSDKILDSTTVTNATSNTCDTADTCSCSNNSVGCDPPGTQQYCVEGICGAICDNTNDYLVTDGTCSYGCDYGDSCEYDNTCPLANYCAGPNNNTYFYGGQCSSQGCSFSQEDCDALDYYEDYTTYCDGDLVKSHRRFHDFSCSLTGCTETVTFVDESIVENCNLNDGNLNNQCGNEDWTCSVIDESNAECAIDDIYANDTLCLNFCTSDIRNYNGVCDPQTYECLYDQEDCNHDGTYCINDDVITRDYYCTPPSCLFNVTHTQDCAIENWTEGGDTPGFGLDPSCIFTHGFCVGADKFAQCTSNVTSTADFDNLDNSTRCFGVRSGMTDYYCALQTCNGGCNYGYVDYPNGCSLLCGAGCQDNEDCSPSRCSVIYNDTCVGKQLKEYDSDKILDSTTVSNATQNTCDTADTCSCSNNSVGCDPPGTQQYCVEGLCGAVCDNVNDYLVTDGTCNYGCDYGDTCEYANTCPLANYCAGPNNNTYFYGGQCSSSGCSFSQQNCDALDYYEDYTTYCDGDLVKSHRKFHDFSCSLTGCTETVTFVDESIVENCNLRDGILHNECGNEDWTCSAVNATVAQCSIKNITANDTLCPNFCSSDIRNYNGVCNPSTYECQYTQEDCDNDGTYCVDDDVITRDYYCSPPSCLFNVTNTQDCAIESWTEGGDTPQYGEDPACIFTHGFCTGADKFAQCTSNVTSTADFDNLDDPDVCFGVRSGMTDYYCYLASCDGGCNYGYVDYPNGCSQACGAQCENNDDCSPYFNGDYCIYQNTCEIESSCDCKDGLSEYCPAPGTVEELTCYYGPRLCTNDGCSLETCNLAEDQYCDPEKGCEDLECLPLASPITHFSDDSTNRTMTFPSGGGSDSSSKVILPEKFRVNTSIVNVTGIPTSLTSENMLDVAIVNDISGSMDDNCGPDAAAQPGETPCKINDLKTATSSFLSMMLNNTNNTAGLVSYSTGLVNYTNLTSNIVPLQNSVDNYAAAGRTCISCGIKQGTLVLQDGSNPIRDMILMSDGEANNCLPGVTCAISVAKAQAIAEAANAWQNHSIHVHTIAFGTDADIATMQQIANVGNGTFYMANETNITDVFNAIAIQLTTTYPTNASMDFGSNGITEWSFIGPYNGDTKVDFLSETKDLIETCSCPDCYFNVTDGSCTIGFSLSSETAGKLALHDLLIDGCILQEPPIFGCQDNDLDTYGINCIPGPDCNDNDVNVHPGAQEVCNGVDDNCNGQTDEGTDGGSCTTGLQGVCSAGNYVCTSGSLVCQQNVQPSTEECNQLDDDCDGLVDEDEVCPVCTNGQTQLCLLQQGVCSGSTETCAGGHWPGCSASNYGPDYQSDENLCDGLDNDCDGTIDEGFDVGATCSIGIGECTRTGTKICSQDHLSTLCNAVPGAPKTEECNSLDDDCDGLIDEEDICPTVCNPLAMPITQFSDGYSSRIVTYPTGGGSDVSSKVIVPTNCYINESYVNITGIPETFSSERKLDVTVVNDISGSMDDNCGADAVAQPGETPCKINDLKTATSEFLNVMLTNTNNTVGLVSYSTGLVNFTGLTNDIAQLQNFANNYVAAGRTCISCGISQGKLILETGSNPSRHMILMSDGEANNCLPGVTCMPSIAKAQAIAEAADAWQNHSIHVHTIAFGADADVATMLQIAQAGNGTFWIANETNLTFVFLDIGNHITKVYPSDVTLDVGSDGVNEWQFVGPYGNNTKVDFLAGFQSIVSNCNCFGCSYDVADKTCTIDLNLALGTKGQLELHNLYINGCLLETVHNSTPPGCVDNDQDGYGHNCVLGLDCNDNDADVHPGAAEVCNGIDDNCNGYTDENTGGAICITDLPGVCSTGTDVCSSGQLICQTPQPSSEICDGLDNDCDGAVDDDGACDDCTNGQTQLCSMQLGVCCESFETCTGGQWPGCAASNYGPYYLPSEICDGLDNDCDGLTDENTGGAICITDLPGVCSTGTNVCSNGELICQTPQPSSEICDDLDNDCNGLVDDDELCAPSCVDIDQDGYGQNCLAGVDCDDSNPLINPVATEICNGVDDNCDGQTDEGCDQCNTVFDISTDYSSYQIGGTVNIFGQASSDCYSGPVALQVLNPENSPVFVDQALPYLDSYMATFILPEGSLSGKYIVFGNYFGITKNNTFMVITNGSSDDDSDGVTNENDDCASTPSGEPVNEFGCACSQITCNDGNSCTDDSCSLGVCSYSNNNAVCDDGLFCTENDVCSSGSCSGQAKSCDDALYCNGVESCNEFTNSCDGGTPIVCSDNNICTIDSCSELTDDCSFTQIQNCLTPHVVINELVSDPAADQEEWIELYNPTNSAVNLSGWKIELLPPSGGNTSLSGILAAGSFYLVENPIGVLNNNNDSIILWDASLTQIDRVSYGNYNDGNASDNAPAAFNPNSTARIYDGVDTGVNSNDFKISCPTKNLSNIEQNCPGYQPLALPASPSNLMISVVGGNINLSWDASAGAVGYHIYFASSPIAFNFATPNASVNGTTYIDTTHMGSQQRYYIIRSVNGGGVEDNNTNVVGKFTFNLVRKAGSTGKNWITMPFNSSIKTASDVISDIGPVANAITRFNSTIQLAQSYLNIGNGTGLNFEIKQGESYELAVSSNITWTVVGKPYASYSSITFNTKGSSGKNWVGLPNPTSLANAGQIMGSVGSSAVSVVRLNPSGQSFETWNGAGTNFATALGEGYEINVNANTTWVPI